MQTNEAKNPSDSSYLGSTGFDRKKSKQKAIREYNPLLEKSVRKVSKL